MLLGSLTTYVHSFVSVYLVEAFKALIRNPIREIQYMLGHWVTGWRSNKHEPTGDPIVTLTPLVTHQDVAQWRSECG